MLLHDWTERPGWEGMHALWLTELLRWVKPRLPEGYRVYIGSIPTVAVGAPEHPDVSVRQWPEDSAPAATPATAAALEPDEEVVVATLDPSKAMYVELRGRLVAAVELVSPRNKDRLVARDTYLTRYLGYLLEGVHLLLVDVHRRPLNFSFADRIAQELQVRDAACPPPAALGYRVGEPAATGGRHLAIWRRPLAVGTPLPEVSLPLAVRLVVPVNLEKTYMSAAADAYLA